MNFFNLKGENRSVHFYLTLTGLLLFFGCKQNPTQTIMLTEADKIEIEQLAKNIPLILSNQGWEAYESKFSQGYRNWSMTRDQVRTRKEYLGLVKDWYDAGNRATGSEVETIDFIPVAPDMTLYLHSQREEFNDPNDSTITRTRDIRFVTIYKKEQGQWKNYFTAFMDAPE